MAEAADPEDGDQVGRTCARDLDRLVGGDARAGQGRGVERVDAVRHADDEVRRCLDELGEAAVDRVAGVPLLGAERLPAGDAVIAAAAGIAEPGHGDAVAERDLRDAGAELLDDADALVAGYEGRRRLDRPVAVRRVDVGVAETGRLDPDEDLARAGNRRLDLLEPQRLGERVHDRRLHQRRCLARPRRPVLSRVDVDMASPFRAPAGSRCRPVASTIARPGCGGIGAWSDVAAGFPHSAGAKTYLLPSRESVTGSMTEIGSTGVTTIPDTTGSLFGCSVRIGATGSSGAGVGAMGATGTR